MTIEKKKQQFNQRLTLEVKESLLTKPCLRAKDIELLTGYSKSACYQLMNDCRENFNGKAGIRTDAITTKSLCLALGTTLEEQMRLIGIAKGYINYG